ncbi:MAG: type IX secretion system membrane protein PorP/SprF [Saprospiraceae bacterium]|nr:type IX secretion system membrane protein PorP/SprF [Saprospiraceae bacterium]
MQKLYFALVICFYGIPLTGQQEQMYTQFMFNKLVYNPAYAGSFESPTLTAVFRKQWMGVEGAPDAQVLSYNQPALGGRVGLGGSIVRQSIGIGTSLTFEFAYSYRIKFKRGVFSAGLLPSVRNIRQNWADDRIYAIDNFDQAIPIDPKNKVVANVGAGVYYYAYNDKWYAGLSVPRLVPNNIDFADIGDFSREVQHVNAMGGYTFKPNDELEITPQALFRYAIGAPFDVETNVSLLLKKKYYGGLTYRVGGDTKGLGESVDILLGLQATENLFFCFSYDIGITKLRKVSNGTFELMARWWFAPPDNVTEYDGSRPF